ncbi:MAG: hypothetical protein LBD73_07200 [Deferribacteraceae bacterium]|jgi:hypothetical protein|nr:hypothetical protein [Deferribacteraceae bacterium]
MNKFICAVLTAALIMAGLYFGIVFSAGSVSKDMPAEYLQNIDNWSLESSYFNPFIHILTINGFNIVFNNERELSIGNIRPSGLSQTEYEFTGSAAFENILFTAKDLEVSIDALSRSQFCLDSSKLNKFKIEPSVTNNPFKYTDGLKGNHFHASSKGKDRMAYGNKILIQKAARQSE